MAALKNFRQVLAYASTLSQHLLGIKSEVIIPLGTCMFFVAFVPAMKFKFSGMTFYVALTKSSETHY